MPKDRAESTYRVRVEAAELARHRNHPEHRANPDEARYGAACYPMSFSKGLNHDNTTGLVADTGDFEAFRKAIDNGFCEPFTTRVPVPRGPDSDGDTNPQRRFWEAPTAGLVHDLQGPDSQAVTMPPAPELCSDELAFEMAEVYELAILRDVPFTAFEEGSGNAAVGGSANRLNNLAYAADGFPGRPRKTDDAGNLSTGTVFRGSSPGVLNGPYLSQFLLIGSSPGAKKPEQGLIEYGAQLVDQTVPVAKEGDDYMTSWDKWLDVQRGYGGTGIQGFSLDQRRFICTPRDLATYVHFDALYQAYLNATLLLLAQKTPFDPAFDLLSGPPGDRLMTDAATGTKVPYNAGGFALWGGPHILSLVTEVATRGLKAVRYQKFNVHLRLRPEALAGRLARADEIEKRLPQICGCFTDMRDALNETLTALDNHPTSGNGADAALLPMAFGEGSPMHPTYGAGHATVAGACVTMIKAFYDTSTVFVRITNPKDETDCDAGFYDKAAIHDALCAGKVVEAGAYHCEMLTKEEQKKAEHCKKDCGVHLPMSKLVFKPCGTYKLVKKNTKKKIAEHVVLHPVDKKTPCCLLTLEGELNKLAANISIGRNMAGVHYFSDYYDSLRMGEQIAIGILEEQALCYPADDFVMSVPTFDGKIRRIGRK